MRHCILLLKKKNNQVELTDNGIKYLSGDTDSDFLSFQTLELKLQRKEKRLDKDAEAEEKNNYFKILESKASTY
jgi:preprotein translocase subunit SecA